MRKSSIERKTIGQMEGSVRNKMCTIRDEGFFQQAYQNTENS